MNPYRWPNWIAIAVGYVAGAAGLAAFGGHQPPLESAFIALLLPSSAAVIYVSATTILAKDRSNLTDDGLAATYGRILLGVTLFIVAMHVLMVTALAGALPLSSWLARAPIVLFGFLGIWVGNLLPRTRPNLALGIRTRRTLWDRDAWIRTHRIAGYVAVFLGLLFVASGMFFSKQHLETILGPVSIAAAFLLAVEHLRSRTA
jgi:uncharacterized membrane protein